MDFSAVTETITNWISQNLHQLLISIAVVTTYVVLDRFSTPRLAESADKGRFRNDAANEAVRIARVVTGTFGVLLLALVWGVDFAGVLFFATTTITLLGVALFASWSLLSNVTAYFILLLHPSFKRGNFVRILEADNYAEGYIADLSPFSTKLVTENREVILYPNNLILGRPTLINPREHFDGVGKIATSSPPDQSAPSGPVLPAEK